jgi:ketosteroid isomerase-like protein
MRALTLFPVLGLLLSCHAPADPHAAEATLMATSRAWAQAAASGDLERVVGFWADDAIVLAPDQPAVVGKAAIREFVKQSTAIPQFSITWEPEQARIAASGELGYLVEHNRVTFADSTGVRHTQFGKGVTIWRKDASGAWKCIVDTWNNSPSERVLPR